MNCRRITLPLQKKKSSYKHTCLRATPYGHKHQHWKQVNLGSLGKLGFHRFCLFQGFLYVTQHFFPLFKTLSTILSNLFQNLCHIDADLKWACKYLDNVKFCFLESGVNVETYVRHGGLHKSIASLGNMCSHTPALLFVKIINTV